MDEGKLQLKIFDNGMFVNSIDFRLYDTPLFAHDKVEEEIGRLRTEILTQFKGKPIHASLFTEDIKTEFSYDDIGQLMVHHLGKVGLFFSEYYRYLRSLSRIRLFVIALSNMGNFSIRDLVLSASFPPWLVLWKPEDLPRKPQLTIFDRIPGPVHSMVQSSFLRLLKFRVEEDAASFLDDFNRKEEEIGQFYKRQFHRWNKEGQAVAAHLTGLGQGEDAYFPIGVEIPEAKAGKSFVVACKLSASNLPGTVQEEFPVSFKLSS